MQLSDSSPTRRLLSLTPIIDVVFLLLMFFMLASSFGRYTGFEVAIGPASTFASAKPATSVLLSVAADGSLSVNGIPVGERHLAQALADAASKEPIRILVRPAPRTTAQALVRAVEAARAAQRGPVVLVK